MKNTSASSTGGGIGFVGLLAVAFIVLKVVGIVDWSWFWVLSPIWGSCLVSIAAIVLIGIIVGVGRSFRLWR